jgi:hypothetical protein
MYLALILEYSNMETKDTTENQNIRVVLIQGGSSNERQFGKEKLEWRKTMLFLL